MYKTRKEDNGMKQNEAARVRDELTGKAVKLFLELPEECQKISHAFMLGMETARKIDPGDKTGKTA